MKKITAFIVAIALIVCSATAFAIAEQTLTEIIESTAVDISTHVKEPVFGSIGGEWAIIGLSRSGVFKDKEYFSSYYKRIEEYVKEHNGILHKKKYTDYSRLIIALTAIGENPCNVSGYDILVPLGDFEKTVWQGINGPVWALIALDCGNYEIPHNPEAKVQATREMYVQYIVDAQNKDGGWSLLKGEKTSDVDITAMVLQALSKYQNNISVKTSIEKALKMLSQCQNEKGGFSTYGTPTLECSAQVLSALCSLGIRYDNPEFVKGGKTVVDDILSYKSETGFKHLTYGERNQMATEQALYSLVALNRFSKNQPGLYTMTDADKLVIKDNEEKDINLMVKSFSDIVNHKNRTEIELLAGKGILKGKSDDIFDPDGTMTRAEFATVVVKAFELKHKGEISFKDVNETDWFYEAVNIAAENGILNGIGEGFFAPYDKITRQESAVMLERCARILGMNTQMDIAAARDILAMYMDYVNTAKWAIIPLAFCVNEGIINEEGMDILPRQVVKRGEVAQMVYRLLERNEKM